MIIAYIEFLAIFFECLIEMSNVFFVSCQSMAVLFVTLWHCR